MRYFLFFILLFSVSTGVDAQSARVRQTSSDSADQNADAVAVKDDASPETMYAEAESYARNKITEFQVKKIPYSDELYRQTLREQKQLAAKYAATLALRQNPSKEDFYYRGMLHWIAENYDGANENLDKFLKNENLSAEKAQAARATKSIIAARRKNFDEAENFLKEYQSGNPIVRRDLFKTESEITKAYREEKSLEKAAPHAENAYRLAKTMFRDTGSRVRALADVLESAAAVFEIFSDLGNQVQADAALEDLRKTAALIEAGGIYYYAVDNQIKYMIETNRKPAALAFYKSALDQAEKDFSVKALREEIKRRLEKREQQYKLLNEMAPELVSVDRTTSGEIKTLASLRGKVVLLDFWATWCGPCIGAFPSLIELHRDFQKDGLEIIGLTRYYGQAEGVSSGVDKESEFAFLRRFKKSYDLPYDFVIARDPANQITYAATSIPTAVIIDRKGVIRYIETGTSGGKEEEIRAVIEKLLAEK